MKYRISVIPALLGAMFSLGLGMFVVSCGQKDSDAQKTSSEGAEKVVKQELAVSSKPVASVPETPAEGPQTYQEYVVELGKVVEARKSLGSRLAMADEVLKAREKTLAEENQALKDAQAGVETLKMQLAAAEQALAEAEKKLADAYAADPEWVAAKEKLDAVTQETDAAYAKTALMIQEAHKKGIHIRPKDLQQGAEAPAPSNP